MSVPASAVVLDGLTFRTPDGALLFENLTLAFGAERTGVVGRNGAGKSTLLRLILGEAQPAAGSVTVRGRAGVLRQALEPPAGATLADVLGAAEALAVLARIEAGAGDEADFGAADWTLPSRLDDALGQVGLSGLEPERPAAGLSGGQLTRAAFAALLLQAPDLILLDEPTNNLDADGRALTAELLAGWNGAAVVVSHDRALLRAMDRIVELGPKGAAVYGGNYDVYRARKDAEAAAAARDLDTAEREAARVAREAQAAVERKARRDSAGRRFAAKGSEPKILLGARAERAELTGAREGRLARRLAEDAAEQLAEAKAKIDRSRSLAFGLPPSGLPAGKAVLAFEGVGFAWPDRAPVLADLSFRLTGPERIAVSGPNGSGKTTLIRLATGDLAPTSGQVTAGVRPAVLDQRTAMLRPDETLAQAYRRLNPEASDNQARAALARFLFRNVAADKPVAALSGGERLRAALACVLTGERPAQFLILDEPTNHLDLASVAAVEAALRDYDGALLVISHDEDFLSAVGVERTVRLGSVRP